MKVKNFLVMMVVALCVAACSNDDESTPSPSQLVADTYSGYTWASFFGGQYTQLTEKESVAVVSNEDGTASVTFVSATWGTLTIADASVTATSGGYTLSGTGTAAMASHQGGTSNYDCTLTGTIATDKSTADFTFNCPDVMNGLTVAFHQGDAPEYLKVSGSYSSYAVASFMGMNMVSNNESISLKADTDNQTVSLSYAGTWGTGSTSALTVAQTNDGYTVSGTGVVAVTSHGGAASNYDFTVTGTISADKATASFVFAFELGAMGTVTATTGLGYAPATDFLPGDYSGYTSMSSAYFEGQITEDETVTITANEDGTVDVAYKYGTIAKATVEVSAEGVYSLSGTGIFAMGMGASTNNYECTMTGTIDAAKEHVEIAFSLPDVMGGSTITFYNGEAPATGE